MIYDASIVDCGSWRLAARAQRTEVVGACSLSWRHLLLRARIGISTLPKGNAFETQGGTRSLRMAPPGEVPAAGGNDGEPRRNNSSRLHIYVDYMHGEPQTRAWRPPCRQLFASLVEHLAHTLSHSHSAVRARGAPWSCPRTWKMHSRERRASRGPTATQVRRRARTAVGVQREGCSWLMKHKHVLHEV